MSTKDALKKIKRGAAEIINEEELKKKLALGRPLNIKLGVDPTSPDLHLGHTVVLNKLKDFQDLGHKIKLIIGDFTARVGDPSGRDQTRPVVSEENIIKNARTYQEQVAKILDVSKIEISHNSHWLYPLGIEGLLELSRHCTVAQMLHRADFKERYNSNTDITILEFLYPLLQGYDSVAVKADIELGGTDQKFNLLMARDIQKDYNVEPQVIITLPLLEGTDGVKKMSKSYGNYIALNDTPSDMFGKIMSISDGLMHKYFELLTDFNMDEIKKMHPKQAKEKLAVHITALYHNVDMAKAALEEFNRIFANKELPSDMESVSIGGGAKKVVDLLMEAGLATSKKEARRLIEQGGVKINGEKVAEDKLVTLETEAVVQVGKRRFKKIIVG